MSPWLVVALCAVVAAALSAAVPQLVAAVPEPLEEPPAPPGSRDAVGDSAPGEEAPADDAAPSAEPEPTEPEEPKELYADIARLPWLRPVAVVAGGLLGGLAAYGTGAHAALAWLVPLTPVLVALSVVDARTKLLPKRLVLPSLAVVLVAMVVAELVTDADALLRAVVAMLVVRSCYWVLWFIHSAGLGFGDVRFSALVGLVLGWAGWAEVAIGSLAALLLFALGPLAALVVTRDRAWLKRALPFGPFMVAGLAVGLAWGPQIAGAIWG